MFKKVIAIFCIFAIILASLAVSVTADSDYDIDTPVIMVAPFTDSRLGLRHEDGSYEDVSISFDAVYSIIESLTDYENSVPAILYGLLTGDYSNLKDLMLNDSDSFFSIMEKLQMNPDGTSKYDVRLTGSTTAAESMGVFIYPAGLGYELCNSMGMKKNKIFCFNNDFRLGQLENAKLLDEFIQQVKAVTGKNKVRIFGYSGGGQITSTYLGLYADKGDVAGVVLNNSPLTGTKLTTSLLDKDCFDLNTDFVIEQLDINYFIKELLKRLNLDFLNGTISELLRDTIVPYIINWGGIWDMVPVEDYERLKAEYLDPVENAALIASSDEYHNNISSKMDSILDHAQDIGINVSVICTTGSNIMTDENSSGDGIVDSVHSSGAVVLPKGETLTTVSYKQVNTCGDHYHVSGNLNIDASTAFLPDNTWFMSDGFHDEYNPNLAARLLISHEQKDVYSYEEYPQFMYFSNWYDSIEVTTDYHGSAKYITKEDTCIELKNTYHEPIKIIDILVNMRNSGLKVQVAPNTTIDNYVTKSFPLTGSMTENTRQYTEFTIVYRVGNEILPRYKHITMTANPVI